MKISRTSLRVWVIALVALFLVSVSYFVVTSTMPEPVDTNLSGIEKAKREDLKHCLLLEKNEAYYVAPGKKIRIEYANLKQELINKTNLLQQATINIVCTKETEYKQIVSVLDLMTTQQIRSYQLLKI